MEAPHNNALLLFRVGPVLCATSSLPVQSIISPPKLTHPPGSSPTHPGIFYHAQHVVSVTDLRHQFGLDEAEWTHPGRMIITEADGVYDALWVDDIIEVIETPKEGWGPLPPLLPKKIFSHTLLIDDKIHLYTELRQLVDIEESGVLRQYIEQLRQDPTAATAPATQEDGQETSKVAKPTDDEKTSQVEHGATVTEDVDISTMAESEANESDRSTPAEDLADTESAPEVTEQANEAGPSEAEAGTVAGGHELGEPATAVAEGTTEPTEPSPDLTEEAEAAAERPEAGSDTSETEETPTHDKASPDSGKEMATEDQTASAEATGDETPESIAPAATAEVEPEQDQAAPDQDETAPADKPGQPPEDPSQTRTVIDERFIIEDEPDIPLVLGEDSDEQPSTLPPQQDLAHSEQSKLGLVMFGLIAVLILAGIAGGLYYYLTSPDTVVDRKEIVQDDKQADNSKTEQAPADTPVVTETQGDETENTIEVTEEAPSKPTPAKSYRADIQPDKEGITILLHAPKGETQLRDHTAAETKKPAKKKSVAKTKKEPKKTHKPTAKTKKKTRIEVIHVVVKGDTLWDIAGYYVNDPFRYPELARLSKIKNPDLIYPGNRVRIIDTNGKR